MRSATRPTQCASLLPLAVEYFWRWKRPESINGADKTLSAHPADALLSDSSPQASRPCKSAAKASPVHGKEIPAPAVKRELEAATC